MNRQLAIVPMVSVLAMLTACGESEGGANFTLGGINNSDKTGTLFIGLSDAVVEGFEEVVLSVDTITLRKLGEDDVVIDRFTSSDLGINDVESFFFDVLEQRSGGQSIAVTELEVPAGSYTDIVLSILDEDVNNSYVTEEGGARKEIFIPSTLSFGSFTVDADEQTTFTVVFDLYKALTYNSGLDRYHLKLNGIRLQDNDGDRKITGDVDSSLFDTESPCDEKTEPTEGNRVYLYEGHGLNVDNLADMFDEDASTTTIPDNAVAPFSMVAVTANGIQWEYDFSFLPSGDYTLVFSCDAAEDDPEDYDGLIIPLPTDQLIELSPLNSAVGCDLPIENCQ